MLKPEVLKWVEQVGDAFLMWAMAFPKNQRPDQVLLMGLTAIPRFEIRGRGWRGSIDQLIDMISPFETCDSRLLEPAVVTVPVMYYSSAPSVEQLRTSGWRRSSGNLLIPHDTRMGMLHAAFAEREAVRQQACA